MTRFTMPIQARRTAGLLLATGLVLAAVTVLDVPGSQAATTSEGLICSAGDDVVHNLDATTGYVSTPDGNSIFVWGFAGSGDAVQLPGPTICANSGDTVTVVLHNRLPEDTSIVFSGQTGVKADGEPAGPQFTVAGDPSTPITSLVQPAKAKSGSTIDTVTYTFTAGPPGTYLYSSGTDVTKQREMGLYGGLVIRPSDPAKANLANGSASSRFDPAHEYLFLMSSLDPALHLAVERNQRFDYTSITPRYFFINGRSMPDTLAPNNAAWLPNQPYGSTIHIKPYDDRTNPQPALIRYLNAGTINYPFHPHGSSETVITRDGAPVTDASGTPASYDKFLLDVGPGQSIDALEKWTNEYDPQGKTVSEGGTCSDLPIGTTDTCEAIPSDIKLPQLQDQIVGPGTETWFSENPYLGGAFGDIPNGIVQNNQCGEYYHVAHSHALYQATNYGASFGGMMTLFRIDPPSGCVSAP
jgi:FtsP/CotA-like multicopper oxidase with cupredoxin domain